MRRRRRRRSGGEIAGGGGGLSHVGDGGRAISADRIAPLGIGMRTSPPTVPPRTGRSGRTKTTSRADIIMMCCLVRSGGWFVVEKGRGENFRGKGVKKEGKPSISLKGGRTKKVRP